MIVNEFINQIKAQGGAFEIKSDWVRVWMPVDLPQELMDYLDTHNDDIRAAMRESLENE